MSSTNTSARDEYLFSAACAPPKQDIILDPQYDNIRLVTPIGRLSYVTLAVPRLVPGSTDLRYSATILMAPDHCGQLWEAICAVANKRWPGEERVHPQTKEKMMMNGATMLQWLTRDQGGLSNPLKRGDDIYMKDPAKNEPYRGLFAISSGVKAANKNGQSQQPIVLNEEGRVMPASEIYSGCYGRLQLTIFAFPQPGQQIPNRGVGVMLNSVQFARHGEKIGGFDALKSATAAFGTLPKSESSSAGGASSASPWMSTGAFAGPTSGGTPFGQSQG